MRILALITARGGSKRLPGKNIKLLGEKPLVIWSIDVLRDITEISDILVSTDDPKIADICRKAGAYVPWLRPSELSSDSSSSVDVAIHALDWYEEKKSPIDGLLLIQPTSPFRTKASIKQGINLYLTHSFNPVVGVSPSHRHPMWAVKIEGDFMVPFFEKHGIGKRLQDLPPAYSVNGSFYLISPKELRARRSFFGENTIPLIIKSQQESLDIDTQFDWNQAEIILEIWNKFNEI